MHSAIAVPNIARIGELLLEFSLKVGWYRSLLFLQNSVVSWWWFGVVVASLVTSTKL